MSRHALLVASITLTVAAGAGATAGCAARAPSVATAARASTARPAAHAATAKRAAAVPKKATPGPEAEVAESESQGVPRKLGDFHVYQYGGRFAKQAVTLTEQVVAMEGSDLVVDFVLEEGSAMSALRVLMHPDGRVSRVTRITADGEVPAAIADYEALVARTAFVPDSNDEDLGTEHTACLVGDEQVDCDVTTYKVTFGEKQARLTITRGPGLPGRDIGGDVVSDDGKVLYSARLVERGNQPPVVETMARADRFVPAGP